MKVRNLINTNGNATVNQFVITDNGEISFQSYDSLVCQIRKGGMGFDKVVVFGRDWDYSRTTMKHLNKFLYDNGLGNLAGAKDIRDAIDRGYMRTNQSVAVIYDKTMH